MYCLGKFLIKFFELWAYESLHENFFKLGPKMGINRSRNPLFSICLMPISNTILHHNVFMLFSCLCCCIVITLLEILYYVIIQFVTSYDYLSFANMFYDFYNKSSFFKVSYYFCNYNVITKFQILPQQLTS